MTIAAPPDLPKLLEVPILLEVKNLVKHFPVRRGFWASGPPAAVRAWTASASTSGAARRSGWWASPAAARPHRADDHEADRPDAGEIRFEGKSIGGIPFEEERAYRRDVQMVFQDPYSSLNPG